MANGPFEQLVFSGGGIRCLWQGGVIDAIREPLGLDPVRLTGVSGGALTACGFILERGELVRDTMIEHFSRQDSNFTFGDLLDDGDGLSPHQGLYREIVERVVDAEAERSIAEGCRLQVLVAHPPSDDWPRTAGTAAIAAYQVDQRVRSNPHMAFAEKAGLRPNLVDGNQAAKEGKLVDLVVGAATIPPVFDPPHWHGAPIVDAGMCDQAPMPDPDEGRTLILLTRQYRNIPDLQERTYVIPSREIPAVKIDFTDPEQLRAAWALGEEDGRRLLDRL